MKTLYRSLLYILILFPFAVNASDVNLHDTLIGYWVLVEKNGEECADNVGIGLALNDDNDSYYVTLLDITPEIIKTDMSFTVYIKFGLDWQVDGDKVLLRLNTEDYTVEIDGLEVGGVKVDADDYDGLYDIILEKLSPWIDRLKADDYDEMTDIVFDDDYMYFTDIKGNRFKSLYVYLEWLDDY